MIVYSKFKINHTIIAFSCKRFRFTSTKNHINVPKAIANKKVGMAIVTTLPKENRKSGWALYRTSKLITQLAF